MKKIFIITAIILALFVVFNFKSENDSSSKNNGIIDTKVNLAKTSTAKSTNTIDIYATNITTQEPRQVELSELELVIEFLDQLKTNNWNGDREECKIDINDIPQEKIDTWKDREMTRMNGLSINPQLEDIYISSSAQQEIKDLVFEARKEFLEYAKANGVAQKYIDEFKNHVLPTDSKHYIFSFSRDPEEPTYSESFYIRGSGKDHTRTLVHFAAVDFHNEARLMRESGILGTPQTEPYSDLQKEIMLRDLGIRWYVYHEMVHSLQKSFVNLHVDPEKNNELFPFRKFEETTMSVSQDLFWKWGYKRVTQGIVLNYDIAAESQSEGLAFDAMMYKYKVSNEQKQAMWNHMFGRLENGKKLLAEIRSRFENNYPDFYPQDFDRYISSCIRNQQNTETKPLVQKLSLRADQLGSYMGYFYPMPPQKVEDFFEQMK